MVIEQKRIGYKSLSRLKSLNDSFGLKKQIVVGIGGILIEDFLQFDPAKLFV